MISKNLVRGLFLMAISLAFGLTSLGYPIGRFGRAGPGLFPLLVSVLLFLVSLSMVIRSFFIEKVALQFNLRNIALIIGSLCAFSLVTHFTDMMVGIVAMVFLSGFAARSYSVSRNVKISIGLIAVAFAFYKLLGLQLPLY